MTDSETIQDIAAALERIADALEAQKPKTVGEVAEEILGHHLGQDMAAAGESGADIRKAQLERAVIEAAIAWIEGRGRRRHHWSQEDKDLANAVNALTASRQPAGVDPGDYTTMAQKRDWK